MYEIKEKKYIDIPKMGRFYVIRTPKRELKNYLVPGKPDIKVPPGTALAFRPSNLFADLIGVKRPLRWSRNRLVVPNKMSPEKKEQVLAFLKNAKP